MTDREELVRLLAEASAAAPYPLLGTQTAGGYADKILANAEIASIVRSGKLLGFLAIYCNQPERDAAYITMLCVDGKTVRQGIGEALLVRGLAIARAHGYGRVRLHVHSANKAALALYRKLGFAEISYGDDGRILLEIGSDPT